MKKILTILMVFGLCFTVWGGWETENGPLPVGTTMLNRIDTIDGDHFFEVRFPGGAEYFYFPARYVDDNGTMVKVREFKLVSTQKREIESEGVLDGLVTSLNETMNELLIVKGWTWQLITHFGLISEPLAK